MNTIELPALSGDTPLGFLAALGLLRLLSMYTDDKPRLSWSPYNLTAQLHTTCTDIDDVVAKLQTIIDEVPTSSVLPGISVGFPPKPSASKAVKDAIESEAEDNTKNKKKNADPLRIPPSKLRAFIETVMPNPDAEIEAWLTSLVTDLSVDKDGRSNISLMMAPSGRQTIYSMLNISYSMLRTKGNTERSSGKSSNMQTLFELESDEVDGSQHTHSSNEVTEDRNDPCFLKEALVAWRRYAGVTGEYLDHQVLYSAVKSSDGRSSERGVPGATWLALMSFPLLRTTTSGSQTITTCWYRRKNKSLVFAYPLWTIPLDQYAITALLEHPLIRQHLDEDIPAELKVLSVFTVEHALRHPIPGRKSAGVLKYSPQ